MYTEEQIKAIKELKAALMDTGLSRFVMWCVDSLGKFLNKK